MMRVATWNINSVRLRSRMVADFLQQFRPDILCLQEIKCAEAQFPFNTFRDLGYDHISVNGQKGYHGVCTVSRWPIAKNETWDFNNTGEARHLGITFSAPTSGRHIEVHNFYVPAGGDIPDPAKNPKFKAKLAFLKAMKQKFAGLGAANDHARVLVGDLNVAPLETDVWSHKQMLKVVSHTPVEVEHLEAAQRAHDWQDVMRRFVPAEEQLFTWWSYRARDWRTSNRGRRLDHVWATPPAAQTAKAMHVHQDARGLERPSDHVPVIVDFEI